MKGSVIKWMSKAGVAATLVLAATGAGAQSYPERAITWVVPYSAGAGTDTVARLLAKAVGDDLGQSIIVENRPGAATRIGADYVVRSKPDGYTVMTADNATLAINPALYSDLSYDPEKDFTFISTIVRLPLLLIAHPDVPANNVSELLEYAKKNPGRLNYGSPGTGSPHHMAMELFKNQTGLDAMHVPYKGAAPALNDVISGQVDIMFLTLSSSLAQMKAGRIKVLGSATTERLAEAPEIPTLSEQGVEGFDASAWQGVVAPAGTPEEVVQTLNASLNRALQDEDLKKQLAAGGLEPMPGTPKEFADYTHEEIQRMKDLVKAQNLKAD